MSISPAKDSAIEIVKTITEDHKQAYLKIEVKRHNEKAKHATLKKKVESRAKLTKTITHTQKMVRTTFVSLKPNVESQRKGAKSSRKTIGLRKFPVFEQKDLSFCSNELVKQEDFSNK